MMTRLLILFKIPHGSVSQTVTTMLEYALLLALAFYLFIYCKRSANSLPLPPGPPGLPFGIGNLLNVPTVRPWEGYTALAHTYGTCCILSRCYLLILGYMQVKLCTYLCCKRTLLCLAPKRQQSCWRNIPTNPSFP